jgi:D-proline reductase (dithiol) PrdB
MVVDSFKYLPRLIAMFYQMTEVTSRRPIPWHPVPGPLDQCTFGLVTSAGLYAAKSDRSFNLERERCEPTWGDPSFRRITRDVSTRDLAISHLHINTADIQRDPNIVFPRERMDELVINGRIAGLAEDNFSFMGYQGYPPDTKAWEHEYGPQVARDFLGAGVQCVILTPV